MQAENQTEWELTEMLTAKELLGRAQALEPQLVEWRRTLHRHPEVGFDLTQTKALVKKALTEMGYEPKDCGKAGVIALAGGKKPGKTILLRGDMDALPIQEESGVDYASEVPGKMHGCGHDMHTAMMLGAAQLLKEHEDEIEGTVKLEFQPAEEIGQGARPLIAAGMLDGAQRVFGLHTASDLPAGTVGVKPGANNAGVDHFIIRIHGKSAHVSTPQLGVDALYIASELVVALQSIVTRMTSPVEPVLIGVGKLNAGTAYNAVAETAVLEGTTRMFSPESRAHLRETINAAAAHISALYGGTAEVEWDDFATPLTNDAGVCGEVERVADALGIPTTANRALSLSGDDFAEYLLQTKGAYAYLGTANPKKPHTCISNHRGDFDIDEETLPLGAALYAAYALSVLDPQFAK